jgi:hypothetical protein
MDTTPRSSSRTRDYVAETDERQYRRGVYIHWQRTFLQPMLANFDAPSREECVAARNVSSTPQQALTLLNDPTFVEAARGLAEEALANRSEDDFAGGLNEAFRRLLARSPSARERESLHAFYEVTARLLPRQAGRGQQGDPRGQPRDEPARRQAGARRLDLGRPRHAQPQRDHRPLLDMNHPFDPRTLGQQQLAWSRRTFLGKSAQALGALALGSLINPKLLAAAGSVPPVADDRWQGIISSPQFPPKAKRVIHLYMAGGPSHLETF